MSASVLLDEVFKLRNKAKWIDMLKIRGSGPTWVTIRTLPAPGFLLQFIGFTGAYKLPGSTKNYRLKPENVESWEVGFEGHFLQNRISFDFAYYSSETTNQIINVPSDWATGVRRWSSTPAACVRGYRTFGAVPARENQKLALEYRCQLVEELE